MSLWDSFWAVVLWFLWATIFIAYLMALFSIIADIMRDRELKGGGKAVWILCLVFLPLITALIYLIARGDGMSERSAREMQKSQQAYHESMAQPAPVTAPAPAPAAAPAVDLTAELSKLADLHASGVLTDAEFAAAKARLLG